VTKHQLTNSAAAFASPDDAGASLPLERVSFTRGEFCLRNGISLSLYNRLKQEGLAPAEMQLGTTIRISIEAELEWQRARTAGDVERKAQARALMVERARHAGRMSVQSERHVSKQRKRVISAREG
jgi:hypothetical protein